MWAYDAGAAKLITVSPRTPRSTNTPRSAPRTTPIKKDDAWIVHSPAKTPTRVVKRVTFADDEIIDAEPKRNVKVSKVGKLFPELKAKFEIVE
ncbi:hypothetical protein KCU73_g8946, partial [Aureobasidium melanogenum]|jgi:hypothetical protein